jgi:hypothetical protein
MPNPSNKRLRLAKSSDTGKCGNKAGLPPRIGKSLAHLRLYSIKPGGCCKNAANNDCKGPKTRNR